ncbi:MAG: flagellar biosynthesis protein FliQ [Pseudobacteriovorax sp.]|nr:flagellar biosynthesis protein FliQ [Pseudobacteriovorax sp.]
MNEQTVIDLGWKTGWLAIQVAAPALLATLFMGLVVSIFQAATQINEQTLSFIPKVLAIAVALLVFGPWIITIMMEFTVGLFQSIPRLSR